VTSGSLRPTTTEKGEAYASVVINARPGGSGIQINAFPNGNRVK